LGTLQINSGLNYLFKLPETRLVQLGIITVITVIFIWTAVSGIDKGIQVLGDINLYLALLLLVLTIVLGPTIKIINSFTNGAGQYINGFIKDSLHINTFGGNRWLNKWRLFYWAWWIAWAPFVGTFIARISKGRTIREFIGGVILAPALASMVWFASFGTMGIDLADQIGVEGLASIAKVPETALFRVFDYYPLSSVLSLIAVALLCTFFVTSANSATFVLGMLTSGGDLNPGNRRKVLWGIVQSLLAISLLFAGGLEALQTASVAAAFPFIFVMLFAIVSLMKALRQEKV
jgi:glycine betaine transporter